MSKLALTGRPASSLNGLLSSGPLRAAAYVRFSSEEQLGGHSLGAQRRAIPEACAERGREIVAWYAGEGISAHTDDMAKRPAFHQMVEDAQQGLFGAIVDH